MSWMRRFAQALVSFVDRELENPGPGRAEALPDPALHNHVPVPVEDAEVPNPVEEQSVPEQNIISPALDIPGRYPPSSPPDSQGKAKGKRPLSPSHATLHPGNKKQKLQHPAQGSAIVLDSPRPGHVARAKSAPADPMRHLSVRNSVSLPLVEATPVPSRKVHPVLDPGCSSAAPQHPLPSVANDSESEGLDDLAAAILAEGMAGEIPDSDAESEYIPSDGHSTGDEDIIPSNEKGMSSDVEDPMVPNHDQASANSASHAIMVMGSDDDSVSDPAEDLDKTTIARLNRNSFILDTRTFCPMCRSPRHRDLPANARKPRVECRHSTFKLWAYHILRQDWHQNFTPAEKLIQLGHTIATCEGIRSQLVTEWNDCNHTPDDDFTDYDALDMARTLSEDQLLSSSLQNMLNVVPSNTSSSKNGGAGYPLLDYGDDFMLD